MSSVTAPLCIHCVYTRQKGRKVRLLATIKRTNDNATRGPTCILRSLVADGAIPVLQIVVKTKVSLSGGCRLWANVKSSLQRPPYCGATPPTGFAVEMGPSPPQPATNKAARHPPALMIRGCFMIVSS